MPSSLALDLFVLSMALSETSIAAREQRSFVSFWPLIFLSICGEYSSWRHCATAQIGHERSFPVNPAASPKWADMRSKGAPLSGSRAGFAAFAGGQSCHMHYSLKCLRVYVKHEGPAWNESRGTSSNRVQPLRIVTMNSSGNLICYGFPMSTYAAANKANPQAKTSASGAPKR